MRHFIRRPVAALLGMALAGNASIASAQTRATDLVAITLEDLLNIKITSASRKEQRADDVAAAVYVITQDEIRRSGMRTLPELFRLVPGVQAAQINANTWAVSVRGFNDQFSNKLLVLIDGRSIYNRAFSGVFWDSIDLLLDDIDRIEIVRGPGGAVWGANAVNGVINIVTKSAADSKGALVRIGGGTSDNKQVSVRYGGAVGKVAYRVQSQWSDHGEFLAAPGRRAGDSYRAAANAIRLDWNAGSNAFTVDGGWVSSEAEPLWPQVNPEAIGLARPPGGLSTTHVGTLLGRWTHTETDGASLRVQAFMDVRRRITPAVHELENFLDFDLQYHKKVSARHDVVAGGGFRSADVRNKGSIAYSLVPAQNDNSVLNFFAQDEIAMGPVKVTLGSKVEHDTTTHWGVQPTARALWHVTRNQRLWAAVSRVLRTPSAHDVSMRVNFAAFPGPTGVPVLLGQIGNPQYHAEEFTDVEAGYRLEVGTRASFDVTAFRGEYDHLQTVEPVAPVFETTPGRPHVFVANQFQNLLEVETHGMEVAAHWMPTAHWRVDGSYSALRLTPRLDPSSRDKAAANFDGNAPRHQWQLRTMVSLGPRAEVDAALFHVGRLREARVPAYTRADARLEIKVAKPLSVILAGTNLFDATHAEFDGPTVIPTTTLVPRRASAQLLWRF